MSWTVVVYSKVCECDLPPQFSSPFGTKRFEVVRCESEEVARGYCEAFSMSDQVLAVEMYGPSGTLFRRDRLLESVQELGVAEAHRLAGSVVFEPRRTRRCT